MVFMLGLKNMSKKDEWFVYIVECSDGTYYCGATNNTKKRVAKHNAGVGAKYTRSRIPVKLIASRGSLSKSQALSLEYKIKQQPRENKISYLLNS